MILILFSLFSNQIVAPILDINRVVEIQVSDDQLRHAAIRLLRLQAIEIGTDDAWMMVDGASGECAPVIGHISQSAEAHLESGLPYAYSSGGSEESRGNETLAATSVGTEPTDGMENDEPPKPKDTCAEVQITGNPPHLNASFRQSLGENEVAVESKSSVESENGEVKNEGRPDVDVSTSARGHENDEMKKEGCFVHHHHSADPEALSAESFGLDTCLPCHSHTESESGDAIHGREQAQHTGTDESPHSIAHSLSPSSCSTASSSPSKTLAQPMLHVPINNDNWVLQEMEQDGIVRVRLLCARRRKGQMLDGHRCAADGAHPVCFVRFWVKELFFLG